MLGLGVTFSTPAFFRAVFATASPAQRGAASGTTSAFLDLGIAGGPLVLGLVTEAQGIASAFGWAAAVAVAGGAWTLALRHGSTGRRAGRAKACGLGL